MKNIFTSTHIVLLTNEENDFVNFSDFKSVDDFKKFLQENHLSYDADEGIFINTNGNDRFSYIHICEKAYYDETGDTAGWDHAGLTNYLNNKLEHEFTWGEEYESAWFVCGDRNNTEDENLEKIFNILKSIDGVEIEIEFSDNYVFIDCELKYIKKK